MIPFDKLADALLAAKYPHIPCAKYDDLLDFHFAVGGEGPLAYEWSDKPHRLVFRLTTELSELRDSIAAIAAAPQPAPEECFCDRMYPDSNPNASCGDCPTRDYSPKPAPAPVRVDGARESPPLPEPTCLGFRNPCGITQLPDMGIYGYTSDQMHAYARAAIAAQQESRNG